MRNTRAPPPVAGALILDLSVQELVRAISSSKPPSMPRASTLGQNHRALKSHSKAQPAVGTRLWARVTCRGRNGLQPRGGHVRTHTRTESEYTSRAYHPGHWEGSWGRLPWFSPQPEVDKTCCHYSKESQSNYLTSDKADFRTRNVIRDKKHIICEKVNSQKKKKNLTVPKAYVSNNKISKSMRQKLIRCLCDVYKFFY